MIRDILDKGNVHLQHPHVADLNPPYLNPHYLVRPGGKHPEPVTEHQLATAFQSSLNLAKNQEMKTNILTAMDDCAQGPSEYTQVVPSSRLRTKLKP